MRIYVDRTEGEFAVCVTQDGERLTMLLDNLPEGVHEGSVLEFDENDRLVLNLQAETERRNELFALQESLFDE